MPTARERIEALVRNLRQRQANEEIALAAWKRALPRCKALTQELLSAAPGAAGAEIVGATLSLCAVNGARAVFAFNRRVLSLEGRRAPAGSDKDAEGDVFFTLRIEPPATVVPNTAAWGPGRVEGVRELTPQAGSQEAFEKAVADFLEWALVGDGCGGEPVRLT